MFLKWFHEILIRFEIAEMHHPRGSFGSTLHSRLNKSITFKDRKTIKTILKSACNC